MVQCKSAVTCNAAVSILALLWVPATLLSTRLPAITPGKDQKMAQGLTPASQVGDLDGRSGSWLCLAQPLSWQPVVKCVGTSDFGTRELRLKQTCRTQSREACQCSFLPMPSSGSTSTHLPEDCASDRCASPEHCPSDRCASPEHTPGGKRHEVSHVSH